jgi:hypothetical protein
MFVSDGQQSYINITSGSEKLQSNAYNFPVRNVYTISSIFKISAQFDYNALLSLAEGDGSGTVPFFSVPVNNTDEYNFPVSSNGFGVGNITGNLKLKNNTWNLLTLTADGTTQKLYLNGILVGSVAHTASFNGANPRLQTGYPGTALYFAPQKVAIMQMWESALTATQVKDLADSYSDRFSLYQPIVSYDFSDPSCYPGTGSTVNNIVNPATFIGTLSGVGFSSSTDSFLFDATGDYIVTDDINLSDNFTYIILFNRGVPITPFQSYYQQTLFSIPYRGGWGSLPYYGIFLSYDFNTTDYNFRTNNGSTYVLNSFNVSNNVGDWTVASLTFSSGTATLYIDGVSASVITGIYSPIPLSEAIQTCIGNNASFFTPEQDQFTGQIAVFQAYNSVLSGIAISSISTNLLDRYAPPPPGYQGNVGGRQLSQGFNG